MGSSELQVQQQLPGTQQQNHDQFQQLYCQRAKLLQQQKFELQQLKRESPPLVSEKEPPDLNLRLTPEVVENEAPPPQQAYSLSWKEFPSNFIAFFKELRDAQELVDVTLACEGRQISAHKVVLAASSPFFRKLLQSNPCQHPIIILNEVRFCELMPLIHYMYHGEVNVQYDQITSFLRTARLLHVRGLTGESPSEDSPKREDPPKREEPQQKKKVDASEPKKEPPDGPIPSPPTEVRRRPRSRSPAPKRIRTAESYSDSLANNLTLGRRSESPASPARRKAPSPHAISPTTLGGIPGTIPTLPPIPGLSLPLSIPSSIASIPPAVTNSLPPGLPAHGSLPTSAQFPHLFAYNPHQQQPAQSHSDDASDAGASDRSEERPRGDLDPDDEQENSLEKMSGLANMAALKGLAGFPGPSGLMSLASGAGLGANTDHSPGRPRFDFYRVRATDPRPCHLCGKIYKNAHTLRTHMEDKHSNCNGFRCVLCGTVAKSRNSLHSHMSRQHRGISTKDLPLLPMPAPWNPEMASKYIQMVGGVGEVVRQNYRRPDRDNSGSREAGREGTLGSDASTPTSQENGALSPYLKAENDKEAARRSYEAISRHIDMNAFATKPPPASSLLDTYLQMMRASGVDLMQGMHEKAWEELRHNAAAAGRGGVLDLTRTTGSPPNYDEEDVTRGSDNCSDDELRTNHCKGEETNGRTRPSVVAVNPRSPEPSDDNEDAKWAVQ